MESCKKCIHYAVCADFYDDEIERTAPCSFFKDASQLVELPCKVGGFVYLVTNLRTIGKYLVTSIEIRKSLVDINWKMIDGVGYPTPFVGAEEIGKTVFLSREEAERVLKERENSG